MDKGDEAIDFELKDAMFSKTQCFEMKGRVLGEQNQEIQENFAL